MSECLAVCMLSEVLVEWLMTTVQTWSVVRTRWWTLWHNVQCQHEWHCYADIVILHFHVYTELLLLLLIIVIWLSKIRVHDWSYTRYVICPNNHFWPVQRSKVPVNITSSWFLVRTLYYHAHQLDILRCVVDFVSCDVTAVSSLKRFISRFLLPFVYLKEF